MSETLDLEQYKARLSLIKFYSDQLFKLCNKYWTRSDWITLDHFQHYSIQLYGILEESLEGLSLAVSLQNTFDCLGLVDYLKQPSSLESWPSLRLKLESYLGEVNFEVVKYSLSLINPMDLWKEIALGNIEGDKRLCERNYQFFLELKYIFILNAGGVSDIQIVIEDGRYGELGYDFEDRMLVWNVSDPEKKWNMIIKSSGRVKDSGQYFMDLIGNVSKPMISLEYKKNLITTLSRHLEIPISILHGYFFSEDGLWGLKK